MDIKPYTCVDDHVVEANCLHCGKSDKFDKPVYTFSDEHMVLVEFRCKACKKDTFIGIHYSNGQIEFCFRKEAF